MQRKLAPSRPGPGTAGRLPTVLPRPGLSYAVSIRLLQASGGPGEKSGVIFPSQMPQTLTVRGAALLRVRSWAQQPPGQLEGKASGLSPDRSQTPGRTHALCCNKMPVILIYQRKPQDQARSIRETDRKGTLSRKHAAARSQKARPGGGRCGRCRRCLPRTPPQPPQRLTYLLVLVVFVHVLDGLIQFLYMKLKGKNTVVQIKTSRETVCWAPHSEALMCRAFLPLNPRKQC